MKHTRKKQIYTEIIGSAILILTASAAFAASFTPSVMYKSITFTLLLISSVALAISIRGIRTLSEKQTDENHARALKWITVLRYGQAQSNNEYFVKKNTPIETTKQVYMNIAELMLLCAAKDGLHPNEKEWVAGLFIACHIDNDIVEFIDSYQEPKNADEFDSRLETLSQSLSEFYKKRGVSIKRNIVFLATLAAQADSILSDEEKEKINMVASIWGLKNSETEEIFDICDAQFEMQKRRKEIIFPEVADQISDLKER